MEDRHFLEHQHLDRSGSIIGPFDFSLAAREYRSAARRIHNEQPRVAPEKSPWTSKEDYLDSTTDDEDDKITNHLTSQNPCKNRRIISQSVCDTLDRTNTSVRQASMITASVLNESDVPASYFALSKSSIHRQRKQKREASAREICQIFSLTSL